MNETPQTAPGEKRRTLDRYLEQEHVLVYVNTAARGLIIPPHLYNNPSVTLKLSRLFRGELWLTDEKVTVDLLFGPNYFTCEVPYDAIWAATSSGGDSEVWADGLPAQIDPQIARQAIAPAPKPEPAKSVAKQARSKAIKRPSHLRVVK